MLKTSLGSQNISWLTSGDENRTGIGALRAG